MRVLPVTLYAGITYWMVGPKDDLGVFLHYTLVAVILVCCVAVVDAWRRT